MKGKFNLVSVVALIVLATVLSIIVVVAPADTDSQITTEVATTQPVVTETVCPTVVITEETVEETQPTVNNPVNDVNNSVDDSVETTEQSYTEEELEILAIIIYQEAGGNACSDDTRRKVGSVFLNRVAHPKFPNTFKAVATAKKQYGRLYWTGIKWPKRAKNKSEKEAVERAYRIAEELLIWGSILPDNVVFQAGFRQGSGVYCYQDGTYFCYLGRKK